MTKWLKNNFGFFLVWILALMPVLIWVFMKSLSDRFVSPSLTFRSLGQLTGLLGMALLSINFILSARFKFLDRWFVGLNRVYIRHHLVGLAAFSLILFHPTFLAIQYLLVSLKSSFVFLFSFSDWPINLGQLAFVVFLILMIITVYMNFKYQNWKKTHQYLGAVLLLSGLHMLLVPSDISNNAYLRYYMLFLAGLGGFSYLYRTILGVYKRGEYKYRLIEVRKVNENTAELKFEPLGEKMKFLPGQFVFLRFGKSAGVGQIGRALSESHPFSITSSPQENILSLGIKILGDYTSMVYTLKPGIVCRIEGSFGTFSYLRASSKRQIWAAGGIGITPFLGMSRHLRLAKGNEDYKIDLYYAVKNESEAAFSEELSEISRQSGKLKLYNHFSDKDGHISAGLIVKNSGEVSGAEVFLCGPSGFMQSLREQFVKLGFDNDRIHSEEFSL